MADDDNPPIMRQMKPLPYEMTPIHLLKGADNNARKHSDAQLTALKNSMAEFGMPSPIIINADYQIVAGHGRWEAAKLLGWTSAPTVRIEHLSPEQQRLFALADNRIAELSTWDETKRAEEFRALRLEMPDLDLTLSGFAHPEIELDIAGLEQTAWSDLDKQPDQIPSKPITQLGDIWDFEGGHTLVCGDSTQADTVAAAVNGETIQLVEEDLPYNLRARDYSGNGKHHHGDFEMAGGEMHGHEFIDFMARSFKAVLPHCKDGALVYGFMDWRHIGQLLSAGERVGFDLKNLVVWDKGKGGMGSLYRSAHELIAVFKHGKAPHINNVMLGKYGRDRHNIWRYAGMNRFGKGRDKALALHGTVKPVELICDLMLDASNKDDVIFDGFGGSGTSLIAAHHLERRAKLIELSPRYCDVAIERFHNAFDSEPTERRTGLTFSQLTEVRVAKPAGGTDGQ